MASSPYRAMVSSDWNECLAPCGPFDAIAHAYPELTAELEETFTAYTANRIPLSLATRKILALLPAPLTIAQMDAYLDDAFQTYTGVDALMRWCRRNDVLFMINTTGMMGYFQRAWAKELLPAVDAISAHPMLRFVAEPGIELTFLDLYEIEDKPKNTQEVMDRFHLPASRLFILGDSGGDGPHFAWGAARGAHLVGCMTKPSLKAYCRKHHIRLDLDFGINHPPGESRDPQSEMGFNFMELANFMDQHI